MGLFFRTFILCAMAASITICSQAQHSALSVEAPDTILFVLQIDGQALTESFATSATGDKLESGRHEIKIDFENSLYALFETSVHLVADKQTTYRLKPKKAADGSVQFGLTLKSERVITIETAEPMAEVQPTTELPIEADTMVIAVDTLPLVPRVGCGSPPSQTVFDQFLEEQNSLSFQFEKQAAAQEFIVDYCLTVEQLRIVINTLDFEDRKLELAIFGRNRVYDPENLSTLESVFLMDMMRERWQTSLREK